MGKAKSINESEQNSQIRPALSPESRDLQLASMAADLAEKKFRDGTASSQLIVYYLKRSSEKEQIELEKIKQENELLKAKADALRSQQRSEELFEKAISAFRRYSGQGDVDDFEDLF